MDTELGIVKRQLWRPKINGHSYLLHALWVLEVRDAAGQFYTYRCEDAETGQVNNRTTRALLSYYEPTEEYQVVN